MDPNGASSAIFWCPVNHSSSLTTNELNSQPHIRRLNQKYSLFAYVISGM